MTTIAARACDPGLREVRRTCGRRGAGGPGAAGSFSAARPWSGRAEERRGACASRPRMRGGFSDIRACHFR